MMGFKKLDDATSRISKIYDCVNPVGNFLVQLRKRIFYVEVLAKYM